MAIITPDGGDSHSAGSTNRCVVWMAGQWSAHSDSLPGLAVCGAGVHTAACVSAYALL